MRISDDEMKLAEELVADIGAAEVKAKDVWNWEKSPQNARLMNMVRKYATKVKFGVFAVDQTFLDAAKSGVAQAKPAKKAAPKATKAKAAAPATAKVGKREKTQLEQLAKATAKTEIGEIMYEQDLIAKGAVKVEQDKAKELINKGEAVYVVDQTFDSKIAVPPLAVDLTDKKANVLFYKL